MGSTCSTQNGTVVAASDLTITAKPVEHGEDTSRTTLDKARNGKEVKMEEKSKPGQNGPIKQQTNDVTDVKLSEKTEQKNVDECDDKLDIAEDAEDDKGSEDDDAEEGKKKKQEPFTEEELRTFKEEKYKNLRSTAEEVFALESFLSEDGEYVKTIRNAIVRFYNSYYALKRASRDEIVKYRLECAKILIETRSFDICCDVTMYTYTNGWYKGKKNELKFSPLNKCLVLLINFTDCSDELTIYLSGKKEFLDFLRNVLVDYRDRHFGKSEPQLKSTEERVLYCVISIVHNLSMREAIIENLRSHGFVQALQPYLDSSKAMYRLNVLASLAGIINEDECEIINANKSSVVFLLKVLANCLANKRGRHRGWSAKESGLAVRTLARNDANKKLLAELGALELLVQLGKTGNTGEQYESAAAIWALCFDADNRVLVTTKEELGVVDLLLELKQGDDPEIKKVCSGALWTLREDLKNSSVEKYNKLGERLVDQNKQHRAEIAQNVAKATEVTSGHVMISYQWGNQEMLKTVRDRIKAYGFKVWMDIDQMGGSTLQAMADAVEGANVFLMCMSNRYKNSPACRAEAEYAFQIRKKIIPLKMEAGYNADGWLGFILGAKLFFDFSGKYPFEDKMAGLLKELDSAMKTIHGKEVKSVQQQVSVVTAAPGAHGTNGLTTSSAAVNTSNAKIPVVMKTLSNVRNWSKEEVKKWIDANDLKVCGFEDMTGSEIAYLAKMQMSAPEFFHNFLHNTLKAKTVSLIARIGWALHDLTDGQQSAS